MVKVGQKIGDSDASFSVPIHSGISGKVIAVSDYQTAMGTVCKAVEIESDGKGEISEEVKKNSIVIFYKFVKFPYSFRLISLHCYFYIFDVQPIFYKFNAI